MATVTPPANPTCVELIRDAAAVGDDCVDPELETHLVYHPSYAGTLGNLWDVARIREAVEQLVSTKRPFIRGSLIVTITAIFVPPNDTTTVMVWFQCQSGLTRRALRDFLLNIARSETFRLQEDSLYKQVGDTVVTKAVACPQHEAAPELAERAVGGSGAQPKGKGKRTRKNVEVLHEEPLAVADVNDNHRGPKRQRQNKGKGKAAAHVEDLTGMGRGQSENELDILEASPLNGNISGSSTKLVISSVPKSIATALMVVRALPTHKLYHRGSFISAAIVSWARAKSFSHDIWEGILSKFEKAIPMEEADMPHTFEHWLQLAGNLVPANHLREETLDVLQKYEASFVYFDRISKTQADKISGIAQVRWHASTFSNPHRTIEDGVTAPGPFGHDWIHREQAGDFVPVNTNQAVNIFTRKKYTSLSTQTDEPLSLGTEHAEFGTARSFDRQPERASGVNEDKAVDGMLEAHQTIGVVSGGEKTIQLEDEYFVFTRDTVIAAELCRLPLRTLNLETAMARAAEFETVFAKEPRETPRIWEFWLGLAGPLCDNPQQTFYLLQNYAGALIHLTQTRRRLADEVRQPSGHPLVHRDVLARRWPDLSQTGGLGELWQRSNLSRADTGRGLEVSFTVRA